MDVVWLKKDVRLHDHAPLAEACSLTGPAGGARRRVCLLFIYEPDMLATGLLKANLGCGLPVN